jgi:hypothetical protein
MQQNLNEESIFQQEPSLAAKLVKAAAAGGRSILERWITWFVNGLR